MWLLDRWIDWVLGQLTPEQWESWRNWLATVGGLVALSIAALTYRRNVKLKREEQARLVYATLMEGHLFEAGEIAHLPANPYRILYSGGWAMRNEDDRSLTIQFKVPHAWARIRVWNGSKELVAPCIVSLKALTDGMVWLSFSATIDALEPETERVVDLVYYDPPEGAWGPEVAPSVHFRDASGRWWQREHAEPVGGSSRPAGWTPRARTTRKASRRPRTR